MAEIDKAYTGSIVSIDFCVERGLELGWNTRGLMGSCSSYTQKHIFVLPAEGFDSCAALCASYYAKMKFGDLIGLLLENNEGEPNVSWLQKSKKVEDLRPYLQKKYACQELTTTDFVSCLLRTHRSHKSIILVNLFSSSSHQTSQLQKLIETCRKVDLHHILFHIYQQNAKNLARTDLIQGITYWPLEEEEIQSLCLNVRVYNSMLVVSNLCIQVECLKGSMSHKSQINSSWKNVDFNIMQKNLYGLFGLQTKEYLTFLTQELREKFIVDLLVSVKYVLVSGEQITGEKILKIKNDSHVINSRTAFSCRDEEFYQHVPITNGLNLYARLGNLGAHVCLYEVKFHPCYEDDYQSFQQV